MNPQRLLLLVVSSIVLGCGGQWDDSPESWARAFGRPLPDEIQIFHSRYWTSSHATHEYMYFFELADGDELKRLHPEIIDIGESREPEYERLRDYYKISQIPEWFAPKDMTHYDSYEWPESRQHAYLDRETGSLFIWGVHLMSESELQ